jgi:predicted transcriptional regulator
MTVNQNLLDLLKPSAPGEDKKWYEVEPADGHRFLSEVLQLRNRRGILKFIGSGIKTKGEIMKTFKLNENVAEVHLVLLEKAMVIEKAGDGYRSTPIGIAFLKNHIQLHLPIAPAVLLELTKEIV